MPRLRLTAPLIEQIAAGVRAGGYPHVVAQAWGVPKATFEGWMGKGVKGNGMCVLLAKTMGVAHAQARLRAEMTISREDSRIWLEHGPARDQPGNPGWSSSARLAPSAEPSLFAHVPMVALIRDAVGQLGEHPEARQIIARTFENYN
ncbi:MAG: hypothetical protein K2X38_02205 [Gemmataceae bacterium]|nr:hypothetical protein [Gemmataceae bacterium]